MNINWKTKSLIFLLIDKFGIYKFLYFTQKYITKKSSIKIESINKKWILHQENLKTLNSPRIIEFGAGKNLGQNIYLSQFVESQFLIDIEPMIDFDLVNESICQLSNICRHIKHVKINNGTDLKKFFNINVKKN